MGEDGYRAGEDGCGLRSGQKWLETLAGKSFSASQRGLKTYARGAKNEHAVVVNLILLVRGFLGTEESLTHAGTE